MGNAVSATVSGLSTAELEQIGQLAIENPAILKLGSIRSGMIAIRVQMEQEMPTAEEQTRIEKLTESVFERRLGK